MSMVYPSRKGVREISERWVTSLSTMSYLCFSSTKPRVSLEKTSWVVVEPMSMPTLLKLRGSSAAP